MPVPDKKFQITDENVPNLKNIILKSKKEGGMNEEKVNSIV